MEIKGLENISPQQLSQEVMQGGKFVVFEFCISLLIVTFKRPSAIYYLRPGEGSIGKSLRYTIVSLFLGWWGFPWGPIYTIGAFVTNFGGGKDVTFEVMNALDGKGQSTTLI
ncbi:MAG TPA: hypothetical protein PKY59_24535 [Pyrinomonadaceae bacterium]|nr:hypothetical protein [Pyrinomonadaceae bacterium]